MKSPKDRVDIDDYDSVEEYIAAAMKEGYVIEAEDFEGRPCAYCCETIPFTDFPDGVVTWDVRVQDPGEEPEPYFSRNYFCSEDCKKSAQYDEEWLRNGSECQDTDMVPEDQLEGMV